MLQPLDYLPNKLELETLQILNLANNKVEQKKWAKALEQLMLAYIM